MLVSQEFEAIRVSLPAELKPLEDYQYPFANINLVFKHFITSGFVHVPDLHDHPLKVRFQIPEKETYTPQQALVVFDQDQTPRFAISCGQEDGQPSLFLHQLDPEDKDLKIIGIGYIVLLFKKQYFNVSYLLPVGDLQPGELIISQRDKEISLEPIAGDKLGA